MDTADKALAEFIGAALDIIKWDKQTNLGDDYSPDALDELPGLISDLKYKLEKMSSA